MAEIRGWNELMAKLSALTGPQIDEVSMKAAEKCAQANAAAAKQLAPTDSGELKGSIHFATEKNGPDGPVSICYTNSDHASFIEFGTGPIGAASGGNGSAVRINHAEGPWQHKSRSGKIFYTDYWVYFDKAKQQFFATRGQPARPFMYPAAKEVEKRAKSIQAAELRKYLKKLEG